MVGRPSPYRYVMENPDWNSTILIPSEVAHEVFPKTEIGNIKDYVSTVDKTKLRQKDYMANRVVRARKYFKSSGAAVPKRKVPKLPKMPPNPEEERVAATKFLHKHAPPVTVIISDPYNGRYRVVAPHGADWKSVSWSKRGISACVFLTLHQAWTYALHFLGTIAPFNIDELLAGIDGDFLDDPP